MKSFDLLVSEAVSFLDRSFWQLPSSIPAQATFLIDISALRSCFRIAYKNIIKRYKIHLPLLSLLVWFFILLVLVFVVTLWLNVLVWLNLLNLFDNSFNGLIISFIWLRLPIFNFSFNLFLCLFERSFVHGVLCRMQNFSSYLIN